MYVLYKIYKYLIRIRCFFSFDVSVTNIDTSAATTSVRVCVGVCVCVCRCDCDCVCVCGGREHVPPAYWVRQLFKQLLTGLTPKGVSVSQCADIIADNADNPGYAFETLA